MKPKKVNWEYLSEAFKPEKGCEYCMEQAVLKGVGGTLRFVTDEVVSVSSFGCVSSFEFKHCPYCGRKLGHLSEVR